MDISSARAKIKLMKRKTHDSLEELQLPNTKKTRTAWLKTSIKIMDGIYGKFNLLIENKNYRSTKDRENTRVYFSIGENNLAGLVSVLIDTKKMKVTQNELCGYISAHALERILCSEYAISGNDFLSAYIEFHKAVDKPSWEHKEGLNLYTPAGVLCAIKDTDINDNGDVVVFFMIKTFIKHESFTLGNEHDRHYQDVLKTGENKKVFVRNPNV